MIQLRPDQEDLARLKSPLGQLLLGEPRKTMPLLDALVRKARPPLVITVGDVVSRETFASGIHVDVRIIDRLTLRKSTPASDFPSNRVIRVKNPAGVITVESWEAIRQAVKERNALILVDGEEDLLAVPCVMESPENAFVVYGQPSEGVVVVTVTSAKKAEVKAMVDRMTREEAV